MHRYRRSPTLGHVLKVLLVVALFAVATYYLIRVIERRGVARPVRRRSEPRAEQRPVAPDDDEDFLRDLDKRRRRHPEDPDAG
jgi:hypothetical protein